MNKSNESLAQIRAKREREKSNATISCISFYVSLDDVMSLNIWTIISNIGIANIIIIYIYMNLNNRQNITFTLIY